MTSSFFFLFGIKSFLDQFNFFFLIQGYFWTEIRNSKFCKLYILQIKKLKKKSIKVYFFIFFLSYWSHGTCTIFKWLFKRIYIKQYILIEISIMILLPTTKNNFISSFFLAIFWFLEQLLWLLDVRKLTVIRFCTWKVQLLVFISSTTKKQLLWLSLYLSLNVNFINTSNFLIAKSDAKTFRNLKGNAN